MENGNNGIIGRDILVIFEDGEHHFSKKSGKCTGNDSIEISLDNRHIIPKSRVIRIEVLDDG